MKILRNIPLGIVVVGICVFNIQILIAQTIQTQKTINRPVLHEFLTKVIENHPLLLSAKANLRSAQAKAKGKNRPIYNPEIGIGYERAGENTKELEISQTFDFSGKRNSNKSEGNAEVNKAKISFQLEKKKLLISILNQIADYQTASNKYEAIEGRLVLNQEFLKLMEKSNLAGQLPRLELLTARLSLSETLVEKNKAWVERSKAEEALVAIVGEYKLVWPKLLGSPSNDISIPIIIDNLPEMLFAKSNTEISRARIKVAKSATRIDPTVGVRVGEEGDRSLLGFRVSMPIPAWNSRKSGVYAANEDLIKSQQDYFVTRRRVMAKYQGSKSRYQSVLDAWDEWNRQGALPLKEQRDLLNRLLLAQEISALDYIIQLNQTFDVEIASLELNGRLWNASFDLKDASNSLDKWLLEIQ